MIIINKRNGKCQSCETSVVIGSGFAYLNGNRWLTACASTACHKRLGITPPNKVIKNAIVARKLHEDGRVEMPFDRDALPLIKGMPNARWNPGEKVWTVSTNVKDLPRVIEVADRLKLEVPDSFRKAAAHGTEDTRAAEKRAQEFEAPDGRKLFEFQKEGVAFLSRHDNALLGDDQGLGKTVQVIAAVPENTAIIVICPACVKFNWKNEFNGWRPNYKVHVMEGRGSFRIPKPGEVVVINYDILPSYFEIVKEKDGNKYKYINNPNVSDEDKEALSKVTLVCDEVHLCKNYKTNRTKRVKALGTLVDKVWGLTGTPLPNRPQDLYGVLDVLGIRVLGGWNKFVGLFNGFKTRFGYEFGQPTPEVAERLRRVMIRRLKTEVLKDLPPKRHQMITVNGIDNSLGKKLDEYLVKMCVRQGLIKKPESMEELTPRFLKDNVELARKISPCLVAELPDFKEFSAMRALLAESRIPAVLEMVEQYEEQDQPVIIFSSHKKPVEEIAKRDGWALITGDTSPSVRTRIVEEFQAGKLKGLAATIKAAGVGITLTRASEALFIDYDWTPANNVQAEDRIYRIGQTEPVLIKTLQSHHPLDQHIQSLLFTKIAWAHKALDEEVNYTAKPEQKRDVEIELREESDESLAERLSKLEDEKKETERQFFLGRLRGILERERGKACLPEPKLTQKRKVMVNKALQHMCSNCDGALEKDGIGFNRPDAAIGHWLNRSGMVDEVAFRVAERILSRYHAQLGDDFGEIWTPELEVA